MRSSYISYPLLVLLVAATYFGAAELGLSQAFLHANVSPVWPPTGVAIAAVLWLGYRISPAILLGAFLANLATGVSIAIASGIAVGNTLEAVSAVFLLHRFVGLRNPFYRARDTVKYVIIAGALSTAVCATIGNICLCLGGAAEWANFSPMWLTWWLGDGAGALVVAPLLLTWIENPSERWPLRRLAETALLLISLSIVASFVFGVPFFPKGTNYPLGQLTVPFMSWAAFRLGPRGVATAIAVLSGIAIWGTRRGLGPFAEHDPNNSLLILQVFVATVAITALVLAAVVTERKRTEEALSAKEAQLRLITDITPLMLTQCSRELRYQFVNRAYAKLLGLTPEQFEGKPITEIIGEEAYETIRPYVKTVLEGRSVEYEAEIPFQRAGRHFMRVAYMPDRDEQGNVVGWVASLSDITDRKQAEEEREQLLAREQEARADAEAANRIKDEFLATVSHELRTPLNSMLGWAHLMRTGQLDKATSARALETLERNAKAQAKLIEDLLDVSRIITGKLRLNICPVELTYVIRAAIDLLRPAASAKGIQLECRMEQSANWVSGDPDRLQQVVWNLLSNAIKFTPKGGRVEIQLECEGSNARLTVTDTGEGISPEFLPHVFDRFSQADSSRTRRHSGLGLGLAIVRHIMELHGGTASADSKGKGQGSTFTISLPLLATQYDENPEHERLTDQHDAVFARPVSLEGVRVLVVDDEADARELITMILEQHGAQVKAVGSAATAFEILTNRSAQSRPDVLVSDIGMPNEDGYDLIRKVRALENEQGGKIPAIALTGYVKAEERVRALAEGYQKYVPKPVEPMELVAIVVSVLGETGNRAN